MLTHVTEFVAERCAAELDESGVEVAGDILLNFVTGGKCLRSTFMYLGWLAGAADSDEALFASASLELLHAFALLQDDVMDAFAVSPRPSCRAYPIQPVAPKAGVVRAGRTIRRISGDPARRLCLIWAEQMLRESGVEHRRLQQAWPRYDAMRTELGGGPVCRSGKRCPRPAVDGRGAGGGAAQVGQLHRRRPLEIGAAMSGCSDRTISGLGRYGEAVGEAFQLRDDLLGVFGAEAVTGKPSGQDLIERKATSVVIAAHQLADAPTRRQLTELMNNGDLDDTAIDRWRTLIVTTGAVQWIEDKISDRVASALEALDELRLDEQVRAALTNMAAVCTERTE